MEGNIIQLKEYHLNKGASKDHTPVFPMTKASAIEGMSELLKDLKINGVTPTSDISEVNSPEKGKIYYEESTDKYYVYREDKSSFVELGAGASIDPSDVMPTITQEASTQSGGDNIITFTFPNGDTTEIVIKNGAQGNSGVASADGVIVVNNLTEGGTNVTENGVTKVKVLSAEMGKELAQQSIIESGAFAKAYRKAVDVNAPFPWVLKDTDGNGNSITKMIWHIGNREFVDAAGANVNWYKDSITVITDGPCAFYFASRNNPNYTRSIILPGAGIHNIPFSSLQIDDTDTYGSIYQGMFIPVETTQVEGSDVLVPKEPQSKLNLYTEKSPNVLYVDFGGLKINKVLYFYESTGGAASHIKSINNFVFNNVRQNDWNYWFNNCPNLKEMTNLRGVLTGGSPFNVFRTSLGGINKNLTRLDLKNLVCPMTQIGSYMLPNIIYLDIRGMNPKLNSTNNSYVLSDYIITDVSNLRTLIIGDFDTSEITGVADGKAFIGSITNCTLVCTKPTPPATNNNGYIIDDLLNKVTTILVPPGSKSAYTANTATWWKDYASKMSEYNEGDY